VTALATIAAGLFAGAALYVTAAEHPGRMECGPALAIREFGPGYRRAAVMQVLLAVAGCGAGVAAWARGAGGGWLAGALLLGALIPFTLLVIMPVNHRLLDATLDRESPEAVDLLTRWGRLHAIRTAVSIAVFVVFVGLALR
jgi:hypothetical protein